jgi:hypothetical protein
MCAINGKYHLEFSVNVYSSPMEENKAEFEDVVRQALLEAEAKLNSNGRIRAHIEEIEEREADSE